MNDALAVLQKYWKHNLRSLQNEIIESVLQGQDTFALMPTGGGKSAVPVPALLNKV
jgi:ATP-dependent DNA helicase RecQ